MPARSHSAAAGVVAAVLAATGALTLLPGAAPTASAQDLVPYASCAALLEHYRGELEKTATPWGFGAGGIGLFDSARSSDTAAPAAAAPQPVGAEAGSATGGVVGSGPTGTNVQERGVDEPDLAKISGNLLLAVAENRLQVLHTGARPELLGSAPLGRDAWGAELLVDGDRVLVLVPQGGWSGRRGFSGGVGPQPGSTTALLFDLSEPATPRLLEQLELDGRYLSARLSDGAVRLVTTSAPAPAATQPVAPYGQEQQATALAANRRKALQVGLSEVLPQIERRTAGGMVLTSGNAVGCGQVRHASSPQGSSTLLVTTLDLRRGLEPRDTTGVTTDGDLVYAAADRLYVATSRWGTTPQPVEDTRPADTATAGVEQKVTTELHAFDTTSADRTAYTGSASVPGYVMGRWALSSHDGHLRVATTSAPPWGGGAPTESGVTVLEERDDGLVQVGRLLGLGVGERIYAVRYFGDLATVVTFRQTDPLYVLDLGDPRAPRKLGELKIPGFSTYLHPVGDDLLLGVGQDADTSGRVTGMQVSLFDLSDRSTPVQVDRLGLGQAWSPAAEDSRAFGFDTGSATALLPLSTWDASPTSEALGIRVDGHRLREAGRLVVRADAPAERVLHDGEHVYAVSRRGVVAGAIADFARTGAVDFAR
ncbi:MAG: beta-propeller domain-containing protein [Mycobacteriales bacterium]